MTAISKARRLIRRVQMNAEGVNHASRERAIFIAKLLQRALAMGESADSLAVQNLKSLKALGGATETVGKIREPVGTLTDALSKGQAQTERISEATEILGDRLQSISDAGAQIRHIAMATKMLALNASIEAKRAGDAGAGFEVIAFEVRKLSQQVEDAVASMAEAVQRVSEANQTIHDEALTMNGVFEEAGQGAERCAESLVHLGEDVGSEVDIARQGADQLSNLVKELKALTGAIRQIETNTHQAIAGSQENIDLCRAIDLALSGQEGSASAA